MSNSSRAVSGSTRAEVELISAATAATLPRVVSALRATLIDGQGTALESLTIQAGDGPLQVVAFGQLNKPNPRASPVSLSRIITAEAT